MIADKDDTKISKAKTARKERLKNDLGDNFYELPVTEIENLITTDVLRSVLIKQNPKKETEINQKVDKLKNFSNKKLGRFIENLFSDINIKQYASDSGAIKNKLEFCTNVIEKTTNYDMLSKEAKGLIEKVYEFIERNNQI